MVEIPFPKHAGNQIYIDSEAQGIETVSAGFAHNMSTQHLFTFVFPQLCTQTIEWLWVICEEKVENKGWTADVEIFKTMEPDFLKIQATELSTIKTVIIGYIVLKVVYKYLRAE